MQFIGFAFRKNIGLFTITFAILLGIYYPARHARRYDCVKLDDILGSLHSESIVQNNLKNCTYDNLLVAPNNEITIDEVSQQKIYSDPKPGGEFIPKDCAPLFSSAIIIPYRDREEQLYIFLNFMHFFLQKQRIHYRIYIIEQKNEFPFNRAKLLNIGAKLAMTDGFPCLILHDLDLIPLNYGNIYVCSRLPRHMSSSLDTFRYNLPYLTLFGGAAAILSSQYREINGMSNLFDGWGGEDDDFYKRLEGCNLKPFRFCPAVSRYTMLKHKKNTVASKNRFDLLQQSTNRRGADGLNALPDNFTIKLEALFTHIIVP